MKAILSGLQAIEQLKIEDIDAAIEWLENSLYIFRTLKGVKAAMTSVPSAILSEWESAVDMDCKEQVESKPTELPPLRERIETISHVTEGRLDTDEDDEVEDAVEMPHVETININSPVFLIAVALYRHPTGLTANEIIEMTGYPASTVANILGYWKNRVVKSVSHGRWTVMDGYDSQLQEAAKNFKPIEKIDRPKTPPAPTTKTRLIELLKTNPGQTVRELTTLLGDVHHNNVYQTLYNYRLTEFVREGSKWYLVGEQPKSVEDEQVHTADEEDTKLENPPTLKFEPQHAIDNALRKAKQDGLNVHELAVATGLPAEKIREYLSADKQKYKEAYLGLYVLEEAS